MLTVVVGLLVIQEGRGQTTLLRPDELLLICNANAAGSRELAEHYARQRGVPEGRLLAVSVEGSKEEITAADYERLIREPVRAYLEQHALRDKVRCLVTFYGLPIRVGKIQITPQRQELLDKWKKRFVSALDELERVNSELEHVDKEGAPAVSARMPTEDDYLSLVQRYAKARTNAWKRIASPAEGKLGKLGQERRRQCLGAIEKTEGTLTLLNQLRQVSGEQSEVTQQQIDQIRQAAEKAAARIQQILVLGLEDPARDEAHDLIGRFTGLIGLLSVLHSDMMQIRPDESEAAVDSELTLLWWGDYYRYRWVGNTLSWRMQNDLNERRQIPDPQWTMPVLMVARIDAPSAAIARRMIDQAITAERQGLKGIVYVDARGLKGREGHALYDQKVRDLAHIIRRYTDLTVRLDNTPAVFSAGRCRDAMLYCGWYSVRKYVDAFDFVPGAVGVHIASFEAVSLKNPGEQGWCKGLLEDGVAATFGPVAEPYLQAFPCPDEFFGLLLTGRFTLAECFFYTNPFNSWMLMLLGDPLYRPFATGPRLTIEQVYAAELIPEALRAHAASQPESRLAPP